METETIIKNTETFLRNFDNISVPRGGMTPQDLAELDALVRLEKKTNLQIADIGVWTGQGTSVLANIVQELGGQVYAIDWFEGSETSNLENIAQYINIRRIFDSTLASNNLTKYVKVIQKISKAAVHEFDDNSLDVIFIDADHRYRYIKEDIALWLPKLKSGGLMLGHDCEVVIKNMEDMLKYTENKDVVGVMHFGVCKAVGELGGQKCSKETVLWYYRKS